MKMKRQAGVSLITAIFLVVVVTSIAAYMVNISNTQQQSTALTLVASRAHQAAVSGLEWGIQRAVQASAAGLNCLPGTVNLSMNAALLNTMSVDVTCSVQSFEEGTTTYNVYNLTSAARLNSFGNPDFVSRTLRASVCVGCP